MTASIAISSIINSAAASYATASNEQRSENLKSSQTAGMCDVAVVGGAFKLWEENA
jgi:hypothetical protein